MEEKEKIMDNKITDDNSKSTGRGSKQHNRRRRVPRKKKLYDNKVIELKPVTKVTKGGRQRRFSAVVVVGDRKGKVGVGAGKAAEIQDAIRKAESQATKNIVKVTLREDRTIFHEIEVRVGSTKVMLKPAPEGRGLVAGGAVRSVLELAGVKDIVSKTFGSRTKKNMAEATIKALLDQKTPEEIKELKSNNKTEA